MVVCPDCGKEVREAKFCSNCGAALPKVEDVNVNVDEAVEDVAVEDVNVNVDEAVEDVAVEDVNVNVDEAVEDVSVAVPVEDVNVDEAVEDVNVIVPAENVNVDDESAEDATETIEANKVGESQFCPDCGREVSIETVFCPNCGYKLKQGSVQETKFCQSCGKKINVNAEICPHCGVRVAGIVPAAEKSVFLAALLSFIFPGLGQIYAGLTKKGITFIIAYIVSAILIFLLIGFILIFIVWIWSLIDAIKSTEALNRGEHVEDKLF